MGLKERRHDARSLTTTRTGKKHEWLQGASGRGRRIKNRAAEINTTINAEIFTAQPDRSKQREGRKGEGGSKRQRKERTLTTVPMEA